MRVLIICASVLLMSCQQDKTLEMLIPPGTIWQLNTLNGNNVSSEATLTFAAARVSGRGPCNTFSAQQNLPYPWIEIELMIASRRACSELSFERDYFQALHQATLMEALGNVLILSNDDGPILVFNRVEQNVPTDP